VLIAVSVTAYVAFAPKEVVTAKVSAKAAAPNFSLPGVNGGTFTLSDYRGKSNVLLFFNEGLSCAPCLQQMQSLDQLNAEFGRMNVIVVDVTADPLQLLTDWTRSSGPQHAKVLSDENLAVSKMYGMLGPDVSMMPYSKPGHTFVLVNTSGVIVWRQDYGPNNMFVPNNQIIALVSKALGAS
jgi:peroxiredoxin Q/BCP